MCIRHTSPLNFQIIDIKFFHPLTIRQYTIVCLYEFVRSGPGFELPKGLGYVKNLSEVRRDVTPVPKQEILNYFNISRLACN